jgi:multidrug efflux pump subunit AcrA (membrane-fusion protein)
LLAQRKQLEAQLCAAEAQLAERVAGPRVEQIAAADAQVRDLAAQQQLQRLNTERRESLLGKNAIAREEYDIARFGLEAVSARLDAARQHLSELQAGVRAEQIAAARAAVDELKAALENLEHDLDDCLLKAPFAGAVAERYVDEGVVITPQTPIVRITENRLLEAWIGLPVKAASQLKVGQVVALRCQGEHFEGTVRAVLPDLDATTQTRGVVVALPEHTPLAAGQVARLGVPEHVHATCYSLPVTALTGASRGLWSCFAVVNDNDGAARLERRDVEVLHTTGEHAWVRGTLRDGDSIVASGTHRVAQGQLVQVVPADGERQKIAFSQRDRGPCN